MKHPIFHEHFESDADLARTERRFAWVAIVSTVCLFVALGLFYA